MSSLSQVQQQLNQLIAQFNAYMASLTTKRNFLYKTAISLIGQDASPYDLATDEYGCADSVNQVFLKAFGRPIAVPGVSTLQLYNVFVADSRFKQVDVPLPGDFVISPTTFGHNPAMPNGHVGIVSDQSKIMSNTSADGIWRENYTLTTWTARYVIGGGYPIKFFRIM